jgi:hypothetical protein
VHAESSHEDAAMRLDYIQHFGGQFAAHFAVALGEGNKVILAQRLCFLGSTGVIEGKVVHNLTGCSASSTPDAFCGVDENGFTHFLKVSGKQWVGHSVSEKIRPVKSISTPCAEKFIS